MIFSTLFSADSGVMVFHMKETTVNASLDLCTSYEKKKILDSECLAAGVNFHSRVKKRKLQKEYITEKLTISRQYRQSQCDSPYG